MAVNRFDLLYNVCLIAICVVCILFFSCTDTSSSKKSDAVSKSKTFPLPEIPLLITDVEQRVNYLLQNYWNDFNFADTVMVNDADISEQGLVNYISIISDNEIADEVMDESMDKFCSKMECHSFSRGFFMEQMDRYLYNPESPYYNENLYGAYLRRMLKSNFLDEYSKSSLQFRLELISRNNPGDTATQFTYYLEDGTGKSLMHTGTGEGGMLVVFYDPLCTNCHRIMTGLMENSNLRKLTDSGKLTVLAVYTEDDEEAWRKSLKDIPESWIVGTDRQSIKERALYDLKAMPSIYLLDKDKRVILKDATIQELLLRVGCL